MNDSPYKPYSYILIQNRCVFVTKKKAHSLKDAQKNVLSKMLKLF